MSRLDSFISIITGEFTNQEQFAELEGTNPDFPLARHVNTACNDRIRNLPEGFAGVFVVEESYYTSHEKTHAAPHLFLFSEQGEGVLLTSYELPEGYTKDDFTYENLRDVDFCDLKPSEKFTPALYVQKDGVWEGGSTSQFSPVLTFTLFERFSDECLEVTETMEVRGKRTFGYDVPLLYKRVR